MRNIDGVDVLEIADVMARLDIQIARVRQLLYTGELEKLKIGNTVFVPLASVERFEQTRKPRGWPQGKKRKVVTPTN